LKARDDCQGLCNDERQIGLRPHNPNLHAQDGLFSLEISSKESRMGGDVDRSSLEAYLQKTIADDSINIHGAKLFYRIRLAWRDAPHLLWRLRQEGIGQATIYPGYGGGGWRFEGGARSVSSTTALASSKRSVTISWPGFSDPKVSF
jgi:hypothetical protein